LGNEEGHRSWRNRRRLVWGIGCNWYKNNMWEYVLSERGQRVWEFQPRWKLYNA
jgi:hypothetical protein